MKLRWLLVPVLVGPLLALTGTAAVAASTFTVSGTTDPTPVPACADTVCPSLRAAVAAANLSPGATVSLGAGTYQLTQGRLTLSGSMTLAGAGTGSTTIQQTGDDRLIDAPGVSTTIEIQDLTLTGGHVVGASFPAGSADSGAILNAASLTLTRVVVTGNSAIGGSDPNPTVATGGENGGSAHAGAIATTGSLTLVSSTVSNNTAQGGTGEPANQSGNGGNADGVIAVEAGALTLTDTTVANNVVMGGPGGTVLSSGGTGGSGGTAYGAVVAAAGTTVTVRGSTFVGNHTTGGAGPSTFNGHSGDGGYVLAGAVYANDNTLDVVNSTFTGNVATAGAGGTIDPGGGGGTAGIDGSAIGGAVLTGSTTSASFSSDTFSNNAALGSAGSAGGNLALESSVAATIEDTIVGLGSSGGSGANCSAGIAPTTLGHNLEDTTPSQCGFLVAQGDLIHVSAQLLPLANNGGPTQTMLPGAGSPVVGAGGACTDLTQVPVGPLTTDQRGVPRPVGGPCDIGAVQIRTPTNTAAPTISPASPTSGQTVTCNHGTFVGDGTLTYATTWNLDGVKITGQAAATYLVRSTDVGHLLTCTVIAGSSSYGKVSQPATSAGQTVTPPPAPVFSAVKQAHVTWRLAKKRGSTVPVGTRFTFGLSQPGTVRLSFTQQVERRKVNGKCVTLTAANKKKPVCPALGVVRGSVTRTGKAGANTIAFAGRLSSGRTLKPGHYVVTVTATGTGGKVSRPVKLRFTIVA